MSMMIPLLITGGTAEERLKRALEVGMGKWEAGKGLGNLDSLLISHPDFLILNSPTSIGIEEIRTLQKRLSFKPFNQGPKIALIQNAQNLTLEAQNAFLKTLEEPLGNSQIILTAPSAESLLPTIVSRCQIIRLPPKAQLSFSKKEISQSLNFLISLLNSSMGERLKKIEKLDLFQDRQKAVEWVDIQTLVLREILLKSLTTSSLKPFNHFSHLTLLSILKSLSQTKAYLQANVNVRLALDNFVLDLPK